MVTRRYRKRPAKKRRGGFFPLLIAAVPALAAAIAASVSAAKGIKEMQGKGLSIMKIHSLNDAASRHHGGRLAPAGYRMLGRGLLSPAGAGYRKRTKTHKVKGHYRYVKKTGAGVKRVHVRAHKAHSAGYIPYR